MTVLQKIIEEIKRVKEFSSPNIIWALDQFIKDLEEELPAEEQQIRDAYKDGYKKGHSDAKCGFDSRSEKFEDKHVLNLKISGI